MNGLIAEGLKRIKDYGYGLRAKEENGKLTLIGDIDEYVDIEEIINLSIYNFDELIEVFNLETLQKIVATNPQELLSEKLFKKCKTSRQDIIDVANFNLSAFKNIMKICNITNEEILEYYSNAESSKKINIAKIVMQYYYSGYKYYEMLDFIDAIMEMSTKFEQSKIMCILGSLLIKGAKNEIYLDSILDEFFESIDKYVSEKLANRIEAKVIMSGGINAICYNRDRASELLSYDEFMKIMDASYKMTLAERFVVCNSKKHREEFLKRYSIVDLVDSLIKYAVEEGDYETINYCIDEDGWVYLSDVFALMLSENVSDFKKFGIDNPIGFIKKRAETIIKDEDYLEGFIDNCLEFDE